MNDLFGGYDGDPVISEFYDLRQDQMDRDDVQFYVNCARQTESKVLEVGCGTGRILLPTAREGIRISGLDGSAYMLNKCREKLLDEPESLQKNVILHQGNINDFSSSECFSLITMPFRPFQHFVNVDEQKACLSKINELLDFNGLLVFDVFNCYLPRLFDTLYHEEVEDTSEITMPDGRKIRRTSRTAEYHHNEQFKIEELIYYITEKNGKEHRYVHSFPMRYFFRYEIEHLLELTGFTLIDLFGNFDRTAYTSDSPEMIFVARKN